MNENELRDKHQKQYEALLSASHSFNAGETITVSGLEGIHKWANGKYKISQVKEKNGIQH